MPMFIAGFEIDVALAEEPSFDSEVTSDPVEDGSDLTNNVKLLPTVLQVEGVVSDNPIGALADRRNPTTLPSQDAYAFLKDLRLKKEPFSVETSKEVFNSMFITNLTPPTSTMNGLRFRATFREITIVQNERTILLVATPTAAHKVNRGSKALDRENAMTVDQYTKSRGITRQEMIDEDNAEVERKRYLRQRFTAAHNAGSPTRTLVGSGGGVPGAGGSF